MAKIYDIANVRAGLSVAGNVLVAQARTGWRFFKALGRQGRREGGRGLPSNVAGGNGGLGLPSATSAGGKGGRGLPSNVVVGRRLLPEASAGGNGGRGLLSAMKKPMRFRSTAELLGL